jgi:hypothetical protein
MFACCTKKDTSLEGALLNELTELNQRMSKIIKQLKFLKPYEYQSDHDRYNTLIPLYQQITLNTLMRTRGYSAPQRLESVTEDDEMVSDETTEEDTTEV